MIHLGDAALAGLEADIASGRVHDGRSLFLAMHNPQLFALRGVYGPKLGVSVPADDSTSTDLTGLIRLVGELRATVAWFNERFAARGTVDVRDADDLRRYLEETLDLEGDADERTRPLAHQIGSSIEIKVVGLDGPDSPGLEIGDVPLITITIDPALLAAWREPTDG